MGHAVRNAGKKFVKEVVERHLVAAPLVALPVVRPVARPVAVLLVVQMGEPQEDQVVDQLQEDQVMVPPVAVLLVDQLQEDQVVVLPVALRQVGQRLVVRQEAVEDQPQGEVVVLPKLLSPPRRRQRHVNVVRA